MTGDEPTGISRRALLALAGGAVLTPLPLLAAAKPFVSKRIAVAATGTGPDVLLIPGLGSAPVVWNALIRDRPGYRYHRFHVRGFAGLPAQLNASGPLLNPLTDEIARYVREAGLTKPAVIGHSMGGTLALLLALKQPVLPGRVMVVDMLPAAAGLIGGTAEGMGFLARQLRQYFTATEAGRRAFANILRDAAPNSAGSDQDVIAAALDELAELDLGPQLPRLRVPLTVVPAVPADQRQRDAVILRVRQTYRTAPGVRVVPVGPSGHMVMLDQPAKFAGVVKEFLGRA